MKIKKRKIAAIKFFFLLFIGTLVFNGCVDEQKILNKKKAEIWKNSTFDWKEPKFKTVKAYYYNTYKSSVTGEVVYKKYPFIIKNGRLNRATWHKAAKQLNNNQINNLTNIFQNKIEDCYNDLNGCSCNPNRGIVFFDDKDFAIASVSICTSCQKVKYSPSNPLNGDCVEAYGKLFYELGIVEPKGLDEVYDFAEQVYGIKQPR